MIDQTTKLIIETPSQEVYVTLKEPMTASEIYHALHCQCAVVMTPAGPGQPTVARVVMDCNYNHPAQADDPIQVDYLHTYTYSALRDIILPTCNTANCNQKELLDSMGVVKCPTPVEKHSEEMKLRAEAGEPLVGESRVTGYCPECGGATWVGYSRCRNCGSQLR